MYFGPFGKQIPSTIPTSSKTSQNLWAPNSPKALRTRGFLGYFKPYPKGPNTLRNLKMPDFWDPKETQGLSLGDSGPS